MDAMAMTMPLFNWNKELEFETIENEMVVCDCGAWLFSQISEKTEEEELLTVTHIIINLMDLEILQDFSSIRILWPGGVAEL